MAGVRSGQLAVALEGLSQTGRRIGEMRRAVGTALIYPLVVAAIAYGLFLLTLVKLAPLMLHAFEDLTSSSEPLLAKMVWLGQTADSWAVWPPLLVVAGLTAAIYALATNPPIAATVRDIMIILLALSTALIGLSLVILVLQLQSLIGLLRDEIRPILDSANRTARTVRGTATFLSDSVVHPVISAASYASGIRQALRLLLERLGVELPRRLRTVETMIPQTAQM